MTRPFLFGGTTGSQSQNKYLVEFRAGKMSMKGKMVIPDKRKGLVYINQTDDSLMHFCWKDRKTGNVEDDLIIFPDDAEFKKVPQCTTGRVFVLKFKSSSRKAFYWMQEPKSDKDDELCSKVNEYLNNPPAPGSASSRGGSGGAGGTSQANDLASLGESDIQSLINNMSQQQLVQLLAGQMGGNLSNVAQLLTGTRPPTSTTSASSESRVGSGGGTVTQVSSAPLPRVPTSEPAPTPSSGAGTTPTAPTVTTPSIQLSDLQNILSGLNVPAGSSRTQPTVDLSNAVTMEALQPLIDNAPLMERLRALLPQTDTPPPPVSEQLRSTVQSPQFQQALAMFSHALQSGQLGPLMQQFGMSKEVVDAANSGDMDAFVKALQASLKQQQQQSAESKKDDDMNLD